MKYLRQMLIILGISFAGELLNYFIPLPIPSGIYGMVLLFIFLCLGIIKLHHIEETGKFLIDIMPVLFIPSAVGIITEIEQLKSICVQIIIITIVSTVIVMAVSGITTQMIIRLRKRKDNKKDGVSE